MFLNDLKVVIKNELGVDLDNDYSRKSNVVDARNIFCDIAYDLNLFTVVCENLYRASLILVKPLRASWLNLCVQVLSSHTVCAIALKLHTLLMGH